MGNSSLHHVVFAIAADRHDETAAMFTDLGYRLNRGDLPELGLRISLDWDGGIELISPLPGATAEVAAFVTRFLAERGDGVYTVVLRVADADAAQSVAERHGGRTRFRQSIDGDGTHLTEVDLSVRSLPLTLLETNIP